jgi:sugar lactone lactonase YvrE
MARLAVALRALVPALASVAIAACSVQHGLLPGSVSSGEGTAASRAVERTNLFVETASSVNEYDSRGHLVRKMTRGFQKVGINAGGLAFDSAGNLYAITGIHSISVYAASSRKLLRTITEGVEAPLALALDARDDLYVGNMFSDTITVYPPGRSNPTVLISQDINGSVDLAFDTSGNLYVANYQGNSVTVYSPTGILIREVKNGVVSPDAILLDSQDDLFVANLGVRVGRSVKVYARNGDEPIQTIHRDVNNPGALALDRFGDLYVSNGGDVTGSARDAGGATTVYDAARRRVLRILSGGGGPIAVDPTGNLYVPTDYHVDVYAPGSSKLLRTFGSGLVAHAMALGPP